MEKLRISKNTQEILSCFYEAQRCPTPVTLWQLVNNQRMISKAFLTDVDTNNECLKLRWELPPDPPFKKNLTLYFHGQQRSILFKGEISKETPSQIHLKIPKEIRVLELREFPRIFYAPDNINELQFEFAYAETQTTANSQPFKAIILDLSQRGAGIILPEEKATSLKVGNKIIITAITPIGLWPTEELLASIVYMRSLKAQEKQQLWGGKGTKMDWKRIGIHFNRQVELTKKEEKVQITPPRPQFLGLSPQEQENLLNELTQKGHPLARELKEFTLRLEKIKYLGKSQLQELLQNCPTDALGRAMHMGTRFLVTKVHELVNPSSKQEFNDILHQNINLNSIVSGQKDTLKTIVKFIDTKNWSIEV